MAKASAATRILFPVTWLLCNASFYLPCCTHQPSALRACRRAFSRKKAAQRAKRMAGQGRAAPQSSGAPWESRDTKPRAAGTGPYAYRYVSVYVTDCT